VRRVTALVSLVVLALVVVPGTASAKTIRKKLKPQPSGDYGKSPKFSAKTVLKTGNRGSLTISAAKLPVGKIWFDIRQAKKGRQPCSPDGNKSTGRGAAKKPLRGPKYPGLQVTGKTAANKVGKGKATATGKLKLKRSAVYYVSVRLKKRSRETMVCSVVSGRPKR
jgi:hypothetical protein